MTTPPRITIDPASLRQRMTHPDDTGEAAYLAYGDYTDWKNFRGEPMPAWADLPPRIMNAWRVAATAVAAILEGTVIAVGANEPGADEHDSEQP